MSYGYGGRRPGRVSRVPELVVPDSRIAVPPRLEARRVARSARETLTHESAYAAMVLEDAPTGYWRLYETRGTTATDEGSGGNDGSIDASVSLGVQGLVAEDLDAAMGFSNDGISMGNVLNMGTGDYAFECWFLLERPTVSPGLTAPLCDKDDGSVGFRVELYDSGGHVRGAIRDATSEIIESSPSTVVNAKDRRRHHVVVNWDRDGDMVVWVDGIESSGSDISGKSASNITNTNNLWIARNTANTRYLEGRMAHVAIYDKVLSPDRIRAHYRRGRGS